MKNFYKISLLTGFCTIALMVLPFQLNAKASSFKPSKKITLNVTFLQATDSLKLRISNKYIGAFVDEPATYYGFKNSNGSFQFTIPVNADFGYFELSSPRTHTGIGSSDDYWIIIEPQFWEQGDSIAIQISAIEKKAGIYAQCQFSGRGSGKYQARYEIQQVKYKNGRPTFDGNILKSTDYLDLSKSAEEKLVKLTQLKSKMSSLSFDILKADIFFSDREGLFFFIQQYYQKMIKSNQTDSANFYRIAFYKKFGSESFNGLSEKGMENSIGFIGYSYRKATCMTYLSHGSFSSHFLFNTLVDNFKGKAREIMLLYYFKTTRKSEYSAAEFQKAVLIIAEEQNQKILKHLSNALPGRKFSDYSLTDWKGNNIKLSDFDDKIVFLDFWFTGCGYCSVFYKTVLSKIEDKFKNNPNVVFLSISTDKTLEKWSVGITSGDYTSLGAVNLFTNGEGFNHAIISENNIYGYPTTILLSKGRVLHSFNAESLYKYDSLLKEIESLL
ncbi:TlpA family protein disulfide reductase [Pedobacter frigoris]|nr:thioredoxin-like domain-containing protein [Pedobacter frigoris]